MTRPGEVTEVKNGMMRVTFCRPEACEACGACEGGKHETSIWVRGNAQVGDIAVVDMPDRTVLKASLTAYGLPLAGLLAGLIIGMAVMPGNETAGAVGAIVGLAASFAGLKATEKNRAGKPSWTPRVIDILDKE